MLTPVIHIVVLLAMPPLLLGIIAKTKAFFAGRIGPPVLQPYWDLIKLFQKGLVVSTTTTWMFMAGPIVTLTAVFLAGLMMPMGAFNAPISFTGDLIFFAYLLALGRFFTTAAALDTGSPFEGMGAARELTFACLAEPALFFALLVLAKLSGSLSLSTMLHGPLVDAWMTSSAPLLLIVACLFVVLLAENCRIPVDDPNTHLELTMIHEVMVLDHSGPLLGAILYGASMKLFVLGALVSRIAAPFQSDWIVLGWIAFFGQMLVLAVIIGVVESMMARLRMRQVPNLLIAACLLGGFGLLLLVT
ncbi:MAG: NADH-quinone oxidoreductase subunit H [Phycisphaerales bacterium]|nr:NADH-quinone oxidoreductase subunit H [Phycisphaerales bacterium]